MKQGYVHPYHSGIVFLHNYIERYPVLFSQMYYMKTLTEATGPEHVSPHYESLSKSRKGLIFLFAYLGSLKMISSMGGWTNNEWMRGLIYHHEMLIALLLGFIEIRHFTFFLGPKFSMFYNTYATYEI
jgi:hypothetical protein